MADIRSMLRAERAARSQQPPRKPAKPPSKKRKADGEDEAEDDSRKRAKGPGSDALPAGFFDPGADRIEAPERTASPSIESTQFTSRPATPATTTTTAPANLPTGFFDASAKPAPQTEPQAGAIDEDEWAAFEREVASPPPEAGRTALAAINSAAVIEANPMTAEELAVQAREEQSAQRGARDAELEAEKEDAARHLEEEFDEMEQLEDRVRKLRQKREALRNTTAEENGMDPEPEASVLDGVTEEGNGVEESDDEDLDDDFDDWRFR